METTLDIAKLKTELEAICMAKDSHPKESHYEKQYRKIIRCQILLGATNNLQPLERYVLFGTFKDGKQEYFGDLELWAPGLILFFGARGEWDECFGYVELNDKTVSVADERKASIDFTIRALLAPHSSHTNSRLELSFIFSVRPNLCSDVPAKVVILQKSTITAFTKDADYSPREFVIPPEQALALERWIVAQLLPS